MANITAEAIQQTYDEFSAIPAHVHLFCPKVTDDDDEDYDDLDDPGSVGIKVKKQRIEDAKNRTDLIYRCSLILGFPSDTAGDLHAQFQNRVGAYLTTCAPCVRRWHRNRKRFLKQLSEEQDESIWTAMEGILNDFDAGRITSGLRGAVEFINSHNGVVEQKTFIQEDRTEMLIALYESLCCITYLSQPENRVDFNYVFEKVQERRTLRLGEALPTMTFFLFDPNPTRQTFAKFSWSRMPEVTADDFEWAVKDSLEDAINKIAMVTEPTPQVQLFWEGLSLILNGLSKDIVTQSLNSLDVHPSIYQTMLNHMGMNSAANLAVVLKAFRTVLEKDPKGLLRNFENYSPTAIAESVYGSAAFKPLLQQMTTYSMTMPENDGPNAAEAIAWIKPYIDSLSKGHKCDVCDKIVYHLVEGYRNDHMSADSRSACYRGAMEAMLCTLTAFLTNLRPSTDTVHTNALLNLVLRHKDVLIKILQSNHEHQSMLQLAMEVAKAALTLDTHVASEESSALEKGDIYVQQDTSRDSVGLWDAFTDILLSPATQLRTQLAMAMLHSISSLKTVEIFRPPKKESLSKPKENFNSAFQRMAKAIGRLFDQMSEMNAVDVSSLLNEPQALRAIIGAVINGEDDINKSALAFIKTATDEINRTDAISRLLQLHFSTVMISFTQALNAIMEKHTIWSPQRLIRQYSREILDGLCDPAIGILRSKSLDHGERKVLLHWWSTQWLFIERALNALEGWSKAVETEVMKTFCREVMEHADALLAQDGLFSSALAPHSIGESSMAGGGNSSKVAMQNLLAAPAGKCMGMVRMLRLKDRWLISVTINTLVKLLRRLDEYKITTPENALIFIRHACTPKPEAKDQRRFEINTNLDDRQRAELLRAIGQDEDDVQIIEVKKAEPKKTQSKLDAWSKSGDVISGTSSTPMAAKPAVSKVDTPKLDKNELDSYASSLVKNRASLDQIKAKQDLKSVIKPTVPKQPDRIQPLSAAKIKESRQREVEAKKKRDAEAVARAKALRQPTKLVPGEGSGLRGLSGVAGKDHAPQKSEMMVNSSSEDEDDSEDDAAFRAQTKASKQRTEDTLSRISGLKMQQVRGPVKKTKIVRTAKDMRARLIPPMDVLHQAILDWDIFHEGNDPPNGTRCSHVSNTYRDPREYKDTFLPLLIYEAWRSFVTEKDETLAKPFGIKVINRMSVDKFIEVSTAMPMNESKDRWLSEGDIILLSVAAKPLEGRNEPHCLARIWRTLVKNGTLEVSYRISGKAGSILPLLIPQAEIFGIRITNMTTIEREYAALESLQYYDLMTEILEAKPSPMLTFSQEAISNLQMIYELNTGQAKAILNAKENDAFTLIQGPPGTGKTKTIIAMVGVFMTGQFSSNTGNVIKKPGAPNSNQGPSKKLLVCAPSNAAVDELVLRLKAGVTTSNGQRHKPNVLRLGRSDAINDAVKDVTLDELVKKRLDGQNGENNGPTQRQKLHEEAGQIKQELSEIRPALEAARSTNERDKTNQLQRRFDDLKRRQKWIGEQIDADKSTGNTAARENEIRRRQVQQEILDSAQVLCATLSGSGHDMFKNLNVEFETVIIDEAAQCVELSALIPLKYGCSRCILVGDPKQLPPTVLSQSAQRYGYDQSLFVRMQKNHPKDVHLLDQQYRMHPEISLFPSQEFYEGRLVDGSDMAKLRHQPWHQTGLLGPYRFFDVKGIQEKGRKGQSLVNMKELEVAAQLYQRFKLDHPKLDLKGKIGIITPYKAQLFALRDEFAARFGPVVKEEIEFNTTDAFQGRECEIIIFSCVRAKETGGIGFMTDIRRMNVGLTRAKSSLWILGDSRALAQGEFWNKLIEDSKARNLYTSGDVIGQLKQKGAKLPPPDFGTTNSAPSPSTSIQPTPTPTKPRPEIVEIDDVDMEDAPPVRPNPNRNKTAQLPQTYTVLERRGPPAAVYSNLPLGYAGLDEHGEAVSQMSSSKSVAPIIHSAGQKRPREPTQEIPQAPKRMAGNQANKPRRRPTDPSALEVLGLSQPGGGSTATVPSRPASARPPVNAPRPPRPRPQANPLMPKKKPPPRKP